MVWRVNESRVVVITASVVTPEPLSGLTGNTESTPSKFNSETDIPPTAESAEDGQYYDDDPSVTFVTDEDIYEDFGGGLPPSGMGRQGHYQYAVLKI
ncbi:unnamed protein product [Allacma fusca]|uniref:Uncharacterized protein n=1 Tax=Allacma fusca TaxID=39272 RepID=A0A8J2PMK7_9HEXA|nr:unnamed protein product [Allacma fusca]